MNTDNLQLDGINKYDSPKSQNMDSLCLYKFIQQAAVIGTWEYNISDNSLEWSDVTKKIHEVDTDYVPSVEEGINFYKKGYSRDAITKLFGDCIEKHENFDIELQIITAKGKVKWVRAMGFAQVKNGKLISVCGAFQDIDDKNKILKNLLLKEEQFRKTFQFAANGMALVDLSGKWIKVNKALSEILGYTKKELLSFSYNEITHWDDFNINTETFEDLVSGKKGTIDLEKRLIHKDGSIVHTQISVSLVRSDKGKPIHYVYQIMDITKIKKAQIENNRLLEISTKQNNQLLNFAHIVSHNLRSHYSNLDMLVDIMKVDKPCATQNEIFPMIEQAVNHLGETVDNLNKIVIIKNAVKDDISNVNLKKVVEKSVSGIQASLLKSNIVVNQNIDEKIFVLAVPAYLDSILINLLTNAIKYKSDKRTLQIDISAKDSHNRVIIEIKDNGLGIDLNLHRNKIFGMYKTFHEHEDSRGLGLFITKNQVEAMGGDIGVTSEVNEGSVFYVTLRK